jgi:DNA-binding HxlR family transcriptional regulator
MVAKQAANLVSSGPQHNETRRKSGVSGLSALELDPVIHERVRLGIVSALAVNAALSFNDLKKLLEITDGNLSVHARKLEAAGYVKCTKSFVGRLPRTEFKLTAAGRRALEGYLGQMESVIRSARKSRTTA